MKTTTKTAMYALMLAALLLTKESKDEKEK